MNTGKDGVPPIFNLKRSSALSCILSFIRIKNEISKFVFKGPIYIDKISWRELAILGYKAEALPKANYIYDQYNHLFKVINNVI